MWHGASARGAGRELYAQDQRSVDVIEAMALVAETDQAQTIADFVVQVTARPYPVRVFSEEASAVAWLRSVTELPTPRLDTEVKTDRESAESSRDAS